MESLRITRSARKHRIGKVFILEALVNAGEPTIEGDSLIYVGADSRGVEIEVVVVPDDRRAGGLAIIHAMPTQYRK